MKNYVKIDIFADTLFCSQDLIRRQIIQNKQHKFMELNIGTKESPMQLQTPPLTSEYTMHVEKKGWAGSIGMYGW